ncbi:hypothetical protein [Stygiolobus caldivivus]|uniref:Uncharacterized protein n=1 Tax=Stygiolobus caldivivus TaxID=2824673 RepID=A0A8D5ZII2_9CREN|nr:hypothetical protein [Stygiolobus caldivivus]BCU69317.1 hypothetical protein KN1_06140 [Stygiolobus caldivivus]
MNKNLSLIAVGILIFLLGLAGNLLMPFYLPYYHQIDSELVNHTVNVKVNPSLTEKVVNVTATDKNNTIYVVTNNSNVNVFIYYNNLTLAFNNSNGFIAARVTPGNYILAINNPTSSPQPVSVHYAVIPAYELSNFDSYSSIAGTVTEFIMAIGIVIAGIGLIKAIFSGKIGTKLDRILQTPDKSKGRK